MFLYSETSRVREPATYGLTDVNSLTSHAQTVSTQSGEVAPDSHLKSVAL